MRNHYENLRVSRDAPPEVIRAAYKVLCSLYHPDKGYAVEAMQDINASYDVLADAAQRQAYDVWLTRFDEPEVFPQRASTAAYDGSPSFQRPLTPKQHLKNAGIALVEFFFGAFMLSLLFVGLIFFGIYINTNHGK